MQLVWTALEQLKLVNPEYAHSSRMQPVTQHVSSGCMQPTLASLVLGKTRPPALTSPFRSHIQPPRVEVRAATCCWAACLPPLHVACLLRCCAGQGSTFRLRHVAARLEGCVVRSSHADCPAAAAAPPTRRLSSKEEDTGRQFICRGPSCLTGAQLELRVASVLTLQVARACCWPQTSVLPPSERRAVASFLCRPLQRGEPAFRAGGPRGRRPRRAHGPQHRHPGVCLASPQPGSADAPACWHRSVAPRHHRCALPGSCSTPWCWCRACPLSRW